MEKGTNHKIGILQETLEGDSVLRMTYTVRGVGYLSPVLIILEGAVVIFLRIIEYR